MKMDEELKNYIRTNPSLEFSKEEYCLAKTTIRDGKEIYISEHCFENFLKRLKENSTKKSLKQLCRLLKNGTEVRRKNNLIQLINHGFKKTDYLFSNGWILVIEEEKILRTAYPIDSEKRKEMYSFEKS